MCSHTKPNARDGLCQGPSTLLPTHANVVHLRTRSRQRRTRTLQSTLAPTARRIVELGVEELRFERVLPLRGFPMIDLEIRQKNRYRQ